jgi:tRNA(Arg) A34 adenosine deaminase TadA
MSDASVAVTLPAWVASSFRLDECHADDESRMRVALEAARQNVLRDTGGPFGAAIFERATGRLVAVGVNRVVPLANSVLHGEIVAFMFAQRRLGTYSLATAQEHELFTSCEPCAMCLGASQWSGVSRVVWSATRDDAHRLSFDEGPVFAASYEYLRARGMEFTGGVLRDEGRAVLELYDARGGRIYNG